MAKENTGLLATRAALAYPPARTLQEDIDLEAGTLVSLSPVMSRQQGHRRIKRAATNTKAGFSEPAQYVESQEAIILRYAKEHGLRVAKVYCDHAEPDAQGSAPTV